MTLTLKDELSSGLDRIKSEFETLKNLGRGLTLGHLEQGGNVLRQVAREAQNLTSSLERVGAVADRVWTKLKRVGSAVGRAMDDQGRVGGFAAAATAYSVAKPIMSAAEYSNTLAHTAITAHQYEADADRMKLALRLRYNEIARTTAQDSHKIGEAGFWLSLTGMDPALVAKMVPTSAKIATAYNTEVGDASRTGFALNYNMGIGADDMERALAMMALLGKHGHYLFQDQAKSMPGVAAAAQRSGMTGMGSLAEIGAAMQISMKVVDPAQPAMAATNLEAFLQQIQQAREEKTFSKFGIDLENALMNGAAKGVSPLNNVLGLIHRAQEHEVKRLHLTNPAQINQSNAHVLSHIMGGRKEAMTFAGAMLANPDEFMHLVKMAKAIGSGADDQMINKDFAEAMRDMSSAVKLLTENLRQGEDRVGFASAPLVKAGNWAVGGALDVLNDLDKKMPGAADAAILATAAILSFGAALATLGVVGPVVAKGWAMVSPVLGAAVRGVAFLSRGLVSAGGAGLEAAGLLTATGATIASVALIAVASAADIYLNWDRFSPFFRKIGDGIESLLWGIADLFKFMGTLNPDFALAAIREIGSGIESILSGALQTAIALVGDLALGLNNLSGGMLFEVFKALNDKLLEIGRSLLGDRDTNQKKYEEYNKQHPDSLPDRGQYGGGSPMGDQGSTGGANETVIILRAEPGTSVDGKPEVRLRLDPAGRVVGRI